jgi:hypothetical protein
MRHVFFPFSRPVLGTENASWTTRLNGADTFGKWADADHGEKRGTGLSRGGRRLRGRRSFASVDESRGTHRVERLRRRVVDDARRRNPLASRHSFAVAVRA